MTAMVPTLLADLLAELLSVHPDIEVVAEVRGERELSRAARQSRPDVVIVATRDGGLPSAVAALWAADPRLRVLVVESGARRASLFHSDGTRESYAEVSVAELLRAIRAA